MSEIHQQLKETIQELERIKKVKLHTLQLAERLQHEENSLAVMETVLQKEQRDVETLEKEGLSTMLRKFIGDREEKLEKEREEYLRASLKYNELYKSVNLIRFELDLLSKKEQDEEVVARRLEAMITMREKEIMELNELHAAELRALVHQHDNLNKYMVEVEEAYNAGMQAHELVRRTEQLLHDALQHGQHDMWGGRSYNRGNLKHFAIDQARDLASQARHALIRFGNELKDVFTDIIIEINLDIEKLNRFTDIFFDNLIFDFIAQQAIKKSVQNIIVTRKEVESALQLLEDEKTKALQKQADLEKQRREIVVKSEK
jgi:hypothetical protein